MIILGECDNAVGMTPSSVGHVSVLGPDCHDVGDIFLAEFEAGPNGRDISGSFFRINLDATAGLRVVKPELVTLIFAVGYPRADGLALALRKIDRVERTLFTLDWIERSEERRVGKEFVSKCKSRWLTYL